MHSEHISVSMLTSTTVLSTSAVKLVLAVVVAILAACMCVSFLPAVSLIVGSEILKQYPASREVFLASEVS